MSLAQIISEHAQQLAPTSTSIKIRLKKIPNIRAILFDVYGTLFLSGAKDELIFNNSKLERAFNSAGVVPPEDCVAFLEELGNVHAKLKREAFDGGTEYPEIDIRAIWKAMLPARTQKEIEALITHYESMTNPIWPTPHLAKTLQSLNQRKLQLGIISNGQFYTPPIFEALAGSSLREFGFLFEACIFSYELKESKPSKALLKKALVPLQSNFGIKPEEILVVGNDMLKDILPAQELGMKTALYAGDTRSLNLRKDDPRCKPLTPDLILSCLFQLLDCID